MATWHEEHMRAPCSIHIWPCSHGGSAWNGTALPRGWLQGSAMLNAKIWPSCKVPVSKPNTSMVWRVWTSCTIRKKKVRKKKQATVNSNSSCPTVEWRLGLVAVFAVAANVVLSSVTAQALYEYACRRSPKVSTSNFQTALNSAWQQGKRAYMCKL